MFRKFLISSLVAGIVLLSFAVGVLYSRSPKMAFINLPKLYDEFNLKKELEQKLTNVQSKRQQSLDSLKISLTALSNVLGNEKLPNHEQLQGQFEAQKEEYVYRNKSYSENNDAMAAQYDDQVWSQLNQYINEYGEKNGYTVVLGGDGSGSVMYTKHSLDITEDMIRYANERYNGK